MVIRKVLYVKYFPQGFLAIEGNLLNFSCQARLFDNRVFFINLWSMKTGLWLFFRVFLPFSGAFLAPSPWNRGKPESRDDKTANLHIIRIVLSTPRMALIRNTW
jgi:hypothetical protein